MSNISYLFFRFTQKQTLVAIIATITLLSWAAVFASAKSGKAEVHFFDVGQGDAIFIELPNGRQILIDGGFNDKVVEKLGDTMPFFDREIDIVIATHNDADHIGGLPQVLAHYDVGAIIWNGAEAETKIFEEFKNAMTGEGAEVIIGRCCMRFDLGENVFFEILYPGPPPLEGGARGGQPDGETPPSLPFLRGGTTPNQNDLSLVIRFVYGNDSFLFTGDIERGVEYEIVKQNFNLKSDILKIPHHGSKTSSSELFLEATNPKVAVISAGRYNPYGHPHEAILQRLAQHGIKVLGTYEEGDVLLLSNGDSF